MGLWDLLTKDIGGGGDRLKWREPMLFRLRLRGDLPFRFLMLAGICAATTGLFFLIFSFNANRPGVGLALGLGLGSGLAAGYLLLFGQRSHATDSVWFYNDHILRQRQYAGLAAITGSMEEWPYGCLSRCLIVSGDNLDLPFHVLLMKADGEWEILGIPARVSLKDVRAVLTGAGVEVAPGSKIPSEFTRGFDVPLLAGVGVAGVLILGLGILMYGKNVGFGGNHRPNRELADQREDIPQPIGPGLPDFPGRDEQQLPSERDPNAAGSNSTERANDTETRTTESRENSLPTLPGETRTNPFQNVPSRPDGVANQSRPGTNSLVAARGNDVRGERSRVVGGEGGFEFALGSKDGSPAVGVRYRMGKWDGGDHFAKLEPLFGAPNPDDRGWESVTAKAGYVVGGVYVHAPKFVDGVQLVFMKLDADGSLNADDIYLSDWIGAGSEDAVLLQGGGAPVVGFHGRSGAVMDAVGVIFRK